MKLLQDGSNLEIPNSEIPVDNKIDSIEIPENTEKDSLTNALGMTSEENVIEKNPETPQILPTNDNLEIPQTNNFQTFQPTDISLTDFSLTAMNLISVNPNFGLTTGGTNLTILGENFCLFPTSVNPSSGILNQSAQSATPSSIIVGAGYNSTDAISLVGRNSELASDPNKSFPLTNMAYWSLTMDFTYYQSLSFYAKQVALHGQMSVCLDGTAWCNGAAGGGIRLSSVPYQTLPTVWTQYTIDLSAISGVHTLYFVGGYVDFTGNLASETQYSDIQLTNSCSNNSTEVILDPSTPAPCTITSMTDTQIQCTTTSHSPGWTDLTINNGTETATLSNAFLYFEPQIELLTGTDTDNTPNNDEIDFSITPATNQIFTQNFKAQVSTNPTDNALNSINYNLYLKSNELCLKPTILNLGNDCTLIPYTQKFSPGDLNSNTTENIWGFKVDTNNDGNFNDETWQIPQSDFTQIISQNFSETDTTNFQIGIKTKDSFSIMRDVYVGGLEVRVEAN
jgi:hypothetical protein